MKSILQNKMLEPVPVNIVAFSLAMVWCNLVCTALCHRRISLSTSYEPVSKVSVTMYGHVFRLGYSLFKGVVFKVQKILTRQCDETVCVCIFQDKNHFLNFSSPWFWDRKRGGGDGAVTQPRSHGGSNQVFKIKLLRIETG